MEDNRQIADMATLIAIDKGLEGWYAKNSAARTAFYIWVNTYGFNTTGPKTSYTGDIERHTPPQTIDDDEEYKPIDERLLSPLSDRQRAVVDMILLDGVSYEEAAERLGITTDSVHSALQKAKERIRKVVKTMRKSEEVAKAQQSADKARLADALDKVGESVEGIFNVLELMLNEIRSKSNFNTKEISREK